MSDRLIPLFPGFSHLRQVIHAQMGKQTAAADLLSQRSHVGKANGQELLLVQIRGQVRLACKIEDEVQAMNGIGGCSVVAPPFDFSG